MAEKNKSTKINKEIQKLTQDLLTLMGLKAEIEVVDNEDFIAVNIEGDDLGLLIGYRGENVESFQLILGLLINRKLSFENWRPILVDVGGWRKQREESLKSLVEKEIQNMAPDQESVDLPPMSPTQRRSIHLIVEDREGFSSSSAGEGSGRHVVITRDSKP